MEHDKKKIVITGGSLLHIQEAFSGFYPFLMIEFFLAGHSRFSHTEARLSLDKMALALSGKVYTIDVSSQRTVSEVVGDITRLFRVTAQVCRKSGNVWNAVSLTDGWTLERQNSAGEYISRIMGAPPEE
jgi:hypothetical protein